VGHLPSGTVTLLFTDIEGSTRLLHELGDGYAALLAEHRRLLRQAFADHAGIEVDTQGDSFFYAFSRATDAVNAADAAQHGLASGRVRVRIGIHTGEPILTDEGYIGIDVHQAARIMAAGHGGQVLVSEATARLVKKDLLRDLGEHRLKDMTGPQHLYQLGDDEFPPLKTLDATNLPNASSQLLGREAEVGELVGLLKDGARMVTLTGPGGTGKTRLALEVASELVGQFHDGVFWVPLAQVTDEELVLPEIGKAIGASSDVVNYLRNREMLLLLDNLEQVLAVAPRLSELVTASPRSRLLVTSRGPLRVMPEHEYPLEPLPLDSAVALFCERARAVGRSVEPDDVVRRICQRLDALPLAIELAAVRTRLLDPPALLARLDRSLPVLTDGARDAPARQRTLRATIEWSYDLLQADARRLFARLAVFTGGATLEAAEVVCEADLDGLGALVEMSLLKLADGGRFQMLETLREYASERLADSGEADDIARRHATYFADLAEQLEEDRHQPGEAADRAPQVAEAANFRAAAMWASSAGDGALQLRLLSAAMWVFIHGPTSSYRRDLEAALAMPVDDAKLRARAEFSLAFATYRQGDNAASAEAARRAIVLAGEARDLRALSYARGILAGVELALGRIEDARHTLERSAEAARQSGEGPMIASALINLGNVELAAGNYTLAQSLSREAQEALRPYGDLEVTSVAAGNLAHACLCLGELDDAEQVARETLEALYSRDDIPMEIACLRILAGVAAHRLELERAAQLIGLLERLRSEVGVGIEPAEQALQDDVMQRLASLGDEVLGAELAIGRGLSVGDAFRAAGRL
jgi:predicted ATPase/class 3 adenylate cyclase